MSATTVTVPTRGALSLGAALSDVRAPTTNELSAVHVEVVKDQAIAVAGAVNNHAGLIDTATAWIAAAATWLVTQLALIVNATIGDGTGTIMAAGQWLFRGAVAWSGVISPASLAATTNDWNPTGLASANVIRVDCTADRSLTGIVYPGSNRLIILTNISAFKLTLEGDSGSSSAGARFASYAVLGPGDTALLWYDSTSPGYWRQINGLSYESWYAMAASMGTDMPLGTNVFLPEVSTSSVDQAATVAQAVQPQTRTVSGAGPDTVTAADVGGVIWCTRNGGTEFNLATLASAIATVNVPQAHMLVLTFQGAHASNVITINPNTSVTIDGSSSNFVGATGRGRIVLTSIDGLAWFSGAA